MNIITVSREFGSGGREFAKFLADLLGYDYYDSEIITMLADKSGLSKEYVEKKVNDFRWVTSSYGKTFSSSVYMNNNVKILVEQKKVLTYIASLGRSCVIVGRNADVILSSYNPFNIFVYASIDSRLKRCQERMEGEFLTEKELLKKIKEIDRNRAKVRELLSNSAWGNRESYHLMVNSTDWSLSELADVVSLFIKKGVENENSVK